MKTLMICAGLAVCVVAGLTLRSAFAASGLPPLQTVPRVDLNRYLGEWHEIARYPNRFQKGCLGSSARYTLREDGEIDVLNSCRDGQSNELRQARGRAWVVDSASNARLKVSFFWPFRGDYWIIELGEQYEYAVIGTPDRNYFWILSRTTTMADDLYAAILQRAAVQGFDATRVVREMPTGDIKQPEKPQR